MTRVELCASDDFESIDRLQAALGALEWVADDTWHDSPIGVGLTRFRRAGEEITVFRDAWVVDVAGPPAAVEQLMERLAGR